MPLLGKAMLVIAGAYLLRALTTSSLAPPGLVVMLALGYALFWLFAQHEWRLPTGWPVAYIAHIAADTRPDAVGNNRTLPRYASGGRSRSSSPALWFSPGLVVERATLRDRLARGFGGSNLRLSRWLWEPMTCCPSLEPCSRWQLH